jgi:chemotaxis protein methyltransferase CheR
LIARRGRERTLRIWSAGCSTGEEPYAIAMTLAAMPELVGWDLRVLATDIDTDVLATAEAGVYAASAVESVPKAMRARFLEPHGSRYRVHDELRSIVRFRRLNLNGESWPMRRPFDVVFCRNVTIYFDLPTQERLYQRLHARLAADGTLFAGHSENLVSMRHLFEPIGVTTYRRVERAGAEPLAAGEAIEAATEASTEAATEAGTSELLAPPAIGSAALDDRLVVCLFEREGGRGALVALPLAQPRRTSVARVLETIERLIGSLEVAGGERPLAAKLVVGPSRARSRARHVSEEVERGLARVSVPVIARREVELRGATLRFDPATTRCRLLGDATIGAVEATRRAS